jgi:hypothetical protein
VLDPIVANDIIPKVAHGPGKITGRVWWGGEIHELRHIGLGGRDGWPIGSRVPIGGHARPIGSDRGRQLQLGSVKSKIEAVQLWWVEYKR